MEQIRDNKTEGEQRELRRWERSGDGENNVGEGLKTEKEDYSHAFHPLGMHYLITVKPRYNEPDLNENLFVTIGLAESIFFVW